MSTFLCFAQLYFLLAFIFPFWQYVEELFVARLSRSASHVMLVVNGPLDTDTARNTRLGKRHSYVLQRHNKTKWT